MEFQKNHFFRSNEAKVAGNRILPRNTPFELSKNFLKQIKNCKIEEKPFTPERRLEEQKNKNHFLNSNHFQK